MTQTHHTAPFGTTLRGITPAASGEGRELAHAVTVPSTRAAAGDVAESRALRVLLVDDEDAVRQALGRRLQNSGFEVHLASTGMQAIRLSRSQQFDAIVSDFRMPGMDGLAAVKMIRAQDENIAVVMMTGDPTECTAADVVRSGVTHYLTKPVARGSLEAVVREAIAERRRAAIASQPPVSSVLSTMPKSAAPVSPRSEWYVGTLISNRYQIEAFVAHGGMCRIYRGEDTTLQREVAIKILSADLVGDDETLARFVREARVASRLQSPNVVQIFDHGCLPDGAPYIVMEYLHGETLHELLERRGRLEPNEAAALTVQLAEGLAMVHDAGIVHRDLKPSNVMLVSTRDGGTSCKLVDFGIAKLVRESGNNALTGRGAIFGTPFYMSPEQAAGGMIDPRSDVYSLGVLLFELLTGSVPFNGPSTFDVLLAHVRTPPPEVTSFPGAESTSPALAAVVRRCLEKDRELRYRTMDDVAVALRQAIA